MPITIGGVQILNLNFLARALETQANGNVLATPNLLTLDNEEARIIIGQNVPFVTGQFTNTGTAGGAVNPFQTIERRDVGTTLRVRPQVSEGGTIRLQIFQEVSSVQSQTVSGLITNRRAIESNVLVDDGQIVVLGGLIEERVEGSVNKVPWLGDVPGVGWLFRYDNRKRTKTNLMVFLRPVLLRTADDSYAVTSDRYDYVRQLQFDARFPQRLLLPDIPPSDLSPMSPSPRSKAAPGQPGGASSTGGPPASLSPDVEAAIRRATAVGEKGRGVIQTAPNEVVVPLPPASGEPQAAPPSAGEPPASQPPPGGSRGN